MVLAVFSCLYRSAGVHFGRNAAGAGGGIWRRLLHSDGNFLPVGSVAKTIGLHLGCLDLLGTGLGLRLGDVGADVKPSLALRYVAVKTSAHIAFFEMKHYN